MNTYLAVKNRILFLCGEKGISLNRLSNESGIAPSTLKNILYGKSKNPGIVSLKILCDGFGISLWEFFNCEEFKNLEQEIN